MNSVNGNVAAIMNDGNDDIGAAVANIPITMSPNLKTMAGVAAFIWNCVVVHGQGTTGYDTAARSMGLAKSSYQAALALDRYVEYSPGVGKFEKEILGRIGNKYDED